jgi:hypothetical protein
MKDFSNYKKHVQIDMKDYSGKFHFNEQLKQEGTDIEINEKSSQTIDNVDTVIRAIVRNHGNEYNESKEERSVMIDKKYDYKTGDYVEYLGDIYLTNTFVDKDNPFFNTAKTTRCNYILKWMIDGVLYEMPAIVTNNTKYTLGIKNLTSGFTEADGMFGAIVGYNDIAKNIPLGKRFIVNGQAWEATQLDHSSVPNVLAILLGETSKVSENDNLELEIADFYQHKYTITLNSTSKSVVEGGTYQISTVVKDDGKEVSSSNVTYKSSNEIIATVDNKGLITAFKTGTTIITCSIGEVKCDLSLSVITKTTIPVINYTTSWTNNNGSVLKLMSSTTVNCVKTVDGIGDNSLVVNYTLDSVASNLVAQKKLTITKVNDTSYTIKNTNTSVVTDISITFTDSVTGTVIETKVIQLKGVS